MKKFLIKKNLFIFRECPEIFSVEDTYLIIGNEENLKMLNLNEFDNVFTIYHTPIWIKHILTTNNINIIQLDESGNVEKAFLHRGLKRTQDNLVGTETCLQLLRFKAKTIDRLFSIREATSLLRYSIGKGFKPHQLNENLNFIIKALLMDVLKLNYKLTNKRAKEIVHILFNLTENIVSYAFYNKFLEQGVNPENGFLNVKSPSLIRDLTEVERIKFFRKLYHLFKSRFFERRDLSRKYFPDTTVKFLKLLSTYFFYGNRFKRLKEIMYILEIYKRGKIDEVFDCL